MNGKMGISPLDSYVFKMLRMKHGIQKCPHIPKKINAPPLWAPRPLCVLWCAEEMENAEGPNLGAEGERRVGVSGWTCFGGGGDGPGGLFSSVTGHQSAHVESCTAFASVLHDGDPYSMTAPEGVRI